jgi:chromosome segregation protein
MTRHGDGPGLAGPLADAPALVYERLQLQGFGRHRDLDVRFPAGLAVWTAPNEHGKTTAVLGLAATLWGVPHRSDPAAPGWGRYRSWHGGPHRGALTLRAPDGRRFTVERAFDTHRVRVRRHDEDGDSLLVDTVHNPAARLAVSPYEAWLHATVGLADGDLALATAVLAQGDLGGDPHRLGDDVQRLLSGAGAGGAAAALERLADALRERTRDLRALDVGLPDLRQPRRLEVLEAEADELLRRAEAGRGAADGLERATRDLADAEAAFERARSEAERTRAAADARRAWTAARDETRRAAERLQAQRAAVERSSELAAEVERAERALVELAGHTPPPPTAEDELRELRAAATAAAVAATRLSEARTSLDEHRQRGDVASAAAHAATALPEVGDRRDWSRLGTPAATAVTRARRAARTVARRVEAASALRERLRSDAAVLDQVQVFDALPPDVLELVSGFGQRERALVERVQAARSRRDDLLERVTRHRAAFADVRQLSQGQLRALEAFDEALERRRDPRPWRVAAAAAAALAGGFGLPPLLASLGVDLPAPGAIGAVIGAVIGAFAPIGDGTARARQAVAEAGLEGDDDDLRQRLRQRSAFDAQYDQVQADARALESAEAALAEHEAEGRAFLDAVEPVLEALPEGVDVDEAYRTWTRLTPLVRAGRGELTALVGDLIEGDDDLSGAATPGGPRVDAERFDEAPVRDDDGALADLVRVAAVTGASLQTAGGVTIGALARWVASLGAADWDGWERAAQAADEERARRDHGGVDASGERRRAWDETLVAVLGAAEAEHAAANEALASAEAVVRRWWPAGSRQPVVEATALIGEEDLDPGRAWPAMPERTPTWRDRGRCGWGRTTRRRLARRRARGGGPRGDPRGAAARGRGGARASGASAQPIGRGPRRPCRAHRAVGAGRRRRPGRLAGAGGAPSDLPDARLDDASAAFERVEAAAADAAAAEHGARDALLEAQRRVAASEGAESVNVAALLEASRERRSEAAAVREEVAALALAYETLAASIGAFAEEHRARLEQRAGAILADVSSQPGRRVRLDDAFAASVVEASGDVALPVQLSQGTRDQLALALRLAVLDAVASDVPLPLVLDDPFAHWDASRLRQARGMLQALARRRQVLLLTHRDEFASWGEPVDGDDASPRALA